MSVPLPRMHMPDATPVAYLTTVVGRSCPVYPPFTLEGLIDVAVNQLHIARDTVKLFRGRRPIYLQGKKKASADQFCVNISLADGDTILVVGTPVLRRLPRDVEKKTLNASKQAQASAQPTADQKSLTLVASPDTSDNKVIRSGGADDGLYHFLKPIVFMLGQRGLRHLYYTARNEYGDFPRSFREHPTMVSIVEYVDRDPDRLKQVLATILEEEPELFRWIETQAEFFLAVINNPPQWQDETSPMWLVRRAKEVYKKEATKHVNKNELTRAVPRGYIQKEVRSQECEENAMMERYFERNCFFDSCNDGLGDNHRINYMRMGAAPSTGAVVGASNEDISCEEMLQLDPHFQELQIVFQALEISKEKWSAAAGNVSQMQPLVYEVQTRLHEAQNTLLQVMENYLMEPPTSALLKRLNTLAQQLWRDSEQWFVEQNDVSASFETALGHLLFETGRELVALDINGRSKERNTASNTRSNSPRVIEHFPLLNTATRWITANGPSLLARELRDYSVHEAVSIVIYSRVSSSSAYAYVVSNGKIEFAPLTMDDTAMDEMKEMECLYHYMGQTYTPKKWLKVRRVIRCRWNNIIGRLYQRLLSPIEELLPPPATLPNIPLSEVKQVCFIHTWASKHAPIPFPALRRPGDGASCALQWAPFMAYRPWNLIQSAEIPWSSPVVEVPTITRLTVPIATRLTTRVQADSMGPKKNMVTYVNTKGTGCASLGSSTGSKKPKGPDAEDGDMWQHVPWASWFRKAVGSVHAGVPTHASVYGSDTTWSSTTALLIHEVDRTAQGWSCNIVEDTKGDGRSPFCETSQMLEGCRVMPYNQCSDLFVTHVLGRESGVGIHRAALLPTFKVMGRSPNEMYTFFLKSLVSNEEMTAAKAYRLALLVSWHTDYKEDPWCPASVMLFNYGGTMKTLKLLYAMYEGRRRVRVPQISGIRRLRLESVVDNKDNASPETNGRPSLRSTVDGSYIERHAVDLIYDVVLNGLSVSRPVGEVAVLDKMIQSIEENSALLDECMERRKQEVDARVVCDNAAISSAAVSPSPQTPLPPPSGTRIPFTFATRRVASITRNGNSGNNKGTNVTRCTGNGKPPSDGRQQRPSE